GRVMSVYSLALIGSGPLNSLLSGALGDLLGAPRAIALTGFVIVVAVALLVQAPGGMAATPAPTSARPDPRDRAPSHPAA
ncbi:MAG: MFS transporter, partial [Armatimonadota bacterium]|nr:MFS transporter [Armatimonadota bacterium]